MNDKLQTKLICVYGRVSTSNQENEGTIETQLSAVYEFAQKNNYTIVKEYKDAGWSGDSIVRPELDQLRVDAKKKMWEAVLMYDPDRLARRYSYQSLVMDELREAGIEVIFVTTPAPKNDEDKILYGVKGLFAEYERAKITERFRLGKVRKAKDGHIIASEAPYGYNFVKRTSEKQGYYEINEIEAQIVKSLFSWVANEGLTLRGIVKRLQNLGILPRKSKRGVWSTSTLSTLLRNETYIGTGHYGASYAMVPINPYKKEGYKKIKKTSRRMRPKDEWISIPTPKIIDESVFVKVQQRLKSNFETSKRSTKNEYLLAGKIFCSCGHRRAGEGPQNGKHLYYRCSSRVHSFPIKHTCMEQGLNARISDKLVWDKLTNIISSPELLIKQAEKYINYQNTPTATTINISEIKKEIAKLKEQVDRYNKAYGVGAFGIEQLKEYTAPIKEKIYTFNNQLAKEQISTVQTNSSDKPNREEIINFAKEASEVIIDLKFEAKKAIVKDVIEKVVSSTGKLTVCGYIPLNYLNHVIFCTSDRHCLDTSQHYLGQKGIPFQFTVKIPPPQRLFGNK